MGLVVFPLKQRSLLPSLSQRKIMTMNTRAGVTHLSCSRFAEMPRLLAIGEFAESCRSDNCVLAMMRKPHTDCFPTPSTFTWQGAGKAAFT
jgi:hypothetical protein